MARRAFHGAARACGSHCAASPARRAEERKSHYGSIQAFRAVRPIPEYASRVAALPYDVMNSDEARDMVKGNPYSFLHVDKAEVDLPVGTELYSEAVYNKAAENLQKLETDGICKQDKSDCMYIYRQIMDGRSQTGLVAACR